VAWLASFFYVLLRPLAWCFARSVYRFHVYFNHRVPASGPVLIVANHGSLWDRWLLIAATSRRLVFLPVSQPKAISAALEAGQAVVVFAEGTLTRNGQMLPFDARLGEVLQTTQCDFPIIPTFLDNLFGTLFTWSSGRMVWKIPEGPMRRPVAVYFGEAVSNPSPQPSPTRGEGVRISVPALRAKVVEAGAECGIRQSDFLLPAPRAFVRKAAKFRQLFRLACVDMATGTERKLTWAKVLVGVWSLADWLRPKLGPEQNVALWMPTSLGSMLGNVALSFCRKTTVNLNYTSGEQAVHSAMLQAGIRTVITSQRFLNKMPLMVPEGVTVILLEAAMTEITPRSRLWKFLAVLMLPGWFLDRVVFGLHKIALDDPMTIMFSSGSTGEPKGVVLSYRNITGNVDSFRRGVEFHDTDRFMVTLPFFHCFGYTVSLWTTLIVGMEAVYFPDPRAAKEVGELCKKHRCTILLGTATFVRFYLRRATPGDFDSLRLLVCGAEKLPVKLAHEFRDRFGILPLEGYGCSELSPVVSVNLPDVNVGGVMQIANHFGTVGQPLPNICMKTFDPETLQPLPHGAEGLLGGLGANVMLGYWQQPKKTAEAVRGGWYISGDVGKIEDDGFIRITGRVSRFAKIAGEMVPLERLDEELHELLGSHGERKLAVAAAPDEKRGERIVVLHLAEITECLPTLFEQLRKQGLPNLWIPDVRDCRIVESFPTLGSGKLDLKRIGEMAQS
jgi:acyl-[acyl-carrier-protein]-phospholipid O-acyltransferase / long-chain-fatty-acid--[acyl-carrier-protein] ligase